MDSESPEEAQSVPSLRYGNTKEHLKFLSKQLIIALNTRTFRETANKLMVPNFSGFHEQDNENLTASDRETLIELMEGFSRENPNFYSDILDMNVEVDEKQGIGRVSMIRTDTGLAEGPDKETFMELSWIKQGSEWLCNGYQGLRHFPYYASG